MRGTGERGNKAIGISHHEEEKDEENGSVARGVIESPGGKLHRSRENFKGMKWDRTQERLHDVAWVL